MNKQNKINPVSKYFLRLFSMLKSNIRDYGMYIALAVIFIVFSVMTGGLFLSPTNFTNLLNQTAYVAVLAVGMTLVIVIREIDLSVGFLGAYMGGFMVVAVERNNQSVFVALLIALIISIVIGFIKGSLIARVKIPSFVVTLGGMFIFKGLLMGKTNNTTIPTTNKFFQKIGIGYLSDHKFALGNIEFNTLTFVLGILVIALIITTAILSRLKNKKLEIENESISIFLTKLIFMIAVVGFIIITLARFNGVSYLLLITIVVTVIYHFATTKTVLGRRIYAVGGNPEAAELSGINVKMITVIVFISIGILSFIAGIMYVSRVQNTSPQHGASWELYAIAAAYIGGTSARGGVGKVVNAVVGAVVIMSIRNGMALAGMSSNIEPVVLGSVLVLAVVFDIYTRNIKETDYVGMVMAKRENIDEYNQTKFEFKSAKKELSEAKKLQLEDIKIVELEYEYTRTLGEYNKVKEKIGNAKETDYLI